MDVILLILYSLCFTVSYNTVSVSISEILLGFSAYLPGMYARQAPTSKPINNPSNGTGTHTSSSLNIMQKTVIS